MILPQPKISSIRLRQRMVIITSAGRDRRWDRRFANLAQLAHAAVDSNVRLNLAGLQILYESFDVVVLVRAQCRAFGQILRQSSRCFTLRRAARKRRFASNGKGRSQMIDYPGFSGTLVSAT
jgi:hypothetical protein